MEYLSPINLLLLLCCCEFTIGVVTISPSGVAPVCPGGQLELMCTTSTTGMFLQWSFDLIRGNEATPTHFTQTITPSSSTMSYLIVNSVAFNFSRISAQNSLPLMSQLLIGPANEGLNGIEVNCEDLDSSEKVMTVIYVVECQCAESDNPVSIQIVSENTTRDGIIVILEWTQDNHTFYSYDVSVTPHAVSTLILGRMRVQLNVSYIIAYNVSVLATPNCGNNITAAASIELYYDEYTGSKLDGEWEPDPNTQSTVNFKNVSTNARKGLLSRDGEIAVASSVTVFTVASILFFIVGFLCGHFCQKKRKSSTAAGETVPPAGSEGAAISEAVTPAGSGQTQTPYYDDVVLQQEEVELKENVAYGPIP